MDSNLILIEPGIYGALTIIYLASATVRRAAKIFEDFLNKLDTKFSALICFGITIFCSQFFILYGHNWGGDFSQYIAQSRAILNGEIQSWLDKQSFMVENSMAGLAPIVFLGQLH